MPECPNRDYLRGSNQKCVKLFDLRIPRKNYLISHFTWGCSNFCSLSPLFLSHLFFQFKAAFLNGISHLIPGPWMTVLHHKATMIETILLGPWKHIDPLWAGTTNSCTTSSSHCFCKPSSPDQSENLSFWVCFCCCCLFPGALPCTMRSREYHRCRCVCVKGVVLRERVCAL